MNPFWHVPDERRVVRNQVLSTVVPQYLKRYLPPSGAVPNTPPVKDNKGEEIYSIWLQGPYDMPDMVAACYRQMEKHCTQPVVILDEKTMFNYIDLPGVIMDKRANGQIGRAHFSDIARVELLHNHGGFWMDASDFVTGPVPKNIVDQDFFVYLVSDKKSYKYAYAMIQNCFIRARRGSYLLDAWRHMLLNYWAHENSALDYMVHQLMFRTLVENDETARELFAKMPHVYQDPTHVIWRHYRDKPFDQKIFAQVAQGAFFQKIKHLYNAPPPAPGTFADVMSKM